MTDQQPINQGKKLIFRSDKTGLLVYRPEDKSTPAQTSHYTPEQIEQLRGYVSCSGHYR